MKSKLSFPVYGFCITLLLVTMVSGEIDASDTEHNVVSSAMETGFLTPRSFNNVNEVRFEVELKDPGQMEREPVAGEEVRVMLENCRLSGSPGFPLLSAQTIRLLLPPQADLSHIRVELRDPVWDNLGDEIDIAPAPPLVQPDGKRSFSCGGEDSDCIENGRDMRIYNQDTFFPLQMVSVVSRGRYRHWKIAEVRVHRIQYNPVQKNARVLRGGTLLVEVSPEDTAVETTATPGEVSSPLFGDRLHQLIINDADVGDFYPSAMAMAAGAEAAGTTRRLAIITTRRIFQDSLELVNYVHFKQSRGHTVYVVYEGDALDAAHYRRGYSAFTRARNIRNWLTTYHAQVDSVLLIGDPRPTTWDEQKSVPMMPAYPDNGSIPPNPADVPTDMYYAELSGNWDLDGDGYLGEYIGDFGPGGIDKYCELEVGRIPFYYYNDLNRILRKLMDYEDQLPGDIGYRSKALISAAVSAFAPNDVDGDGDLDSLPDCCDIPEPSMYVYGDQWGEALKSMAQSHGYMPYTLYEKLGVVHPATPCNAALLRNSLINEWQKGYGYATWWAHGSAGSASRIVWERDDFQPGICNAPTEEGWYSFFEYPDCARLNDNLRGFAVNLSCNNGRPEEFNLGYGLLLEGAVGTVTGTRVTGLHFGPWQVAFAGRGGNPAYGYHIFSAMLAGNSLAGALNTARENADYINFPSPSLANAYAYNLYGDPTLTFASAQDPSAPRLKLTFPNGAADDTQILTIGMFTDIRWESTNLTGNVAIDLTRDNGLTWDTIIANTPNDGYTGWGVTGPESINCRFRARSLVMPHVRDISDAWLTIDLPPIPAAPTGLVATDGAFTDRVRITWNPSAYANSYQVYRTVAGGTMYGFIGGSFTTTYDDTTASSGVTYSYIVRAVNAAGTSAYSNSDNGFVTISIPFPVTPTGVSASDGTYVDKVRVSWNPSNGASFYRIWRALAVIGAWYAEIGTSIVPYYDDTTAAQGNTYRYYVVAANAFFNSGNSETDTGFRAIQILLPTVPTGLSASDGTFTDRVALTWEPSDNATGYSVSRGLAVIGAWYAEIGTSSITSYTDTTAEQGKNYSYRVKSFNYLFQSNYSEPDTGYASIPILLPSVPTGLSASDGDFPDKIELTWKSAENALFYNIYRGFNWNDLVLYSLIDDTSNTSYTDTDVYSGLTYMYAVKGVNQFGESDFSESDAGFLNGCRGDVNLDGDVDGSDLAVFVDSFDEGKLPNFSGDFGRENCLD